MMPLVRSYGKGKELCISVKKTEWIGKVIRGLFVSYNLVQRSRLSHHGPRPRFSSLALDKTDPRYLYRSKQPWIESEKRG